jgi:hypothetical protein
MVVLCGCTELMGAEIALPFDKQAILSQLQLAAGDRGIRERVRVRGARVDAASKLDNAAERLPAL